MTVNIQLASERGVEGNIPLISELHKTIRNITETAILNDIDTEIMREIFRDLEYTLQGLWEFELDESLHKYYREYLFKKLWWGRKFQCQDSGAELEIPFHVQECDFFSVGNGFVDVGRMDNEGNCLYCRIGGNVIEIS